MATDGFLIRRATAADLPLIVAMLADDHHGAARENPAIPLDSAYLAAFREIDTDANQYLAVAELDGVVIGTVQVTFVPGLSHMGGRRGLIEGVRIAKDHRGMRLGSRMMTWCIELCRSRGCQQVQLTTNKSRAAAQNFYDKLGFVQSHFGYKLML
jgi:ribosomal protein S18 acetylase RimI-like enzyme